MDESVARESAASVDRHDERGAAQPFRQVNGSARHRGITTLATGNAADGVYASAANMPQDLRASRREDCRVGRP